MLTKEVSEALKLDLVSILVEQLETLATLQETVLVPAESEVCAATKDIPLDCSDDNGRASSGSSSSLSAAISIGFSRGRDSSSSASEMSDPSEGISANAGSMKLSSRS